MSVFQPQKMADSYHWILKTRIRSCFFFFFSFFLGLRGCGEGGQRNCQSQIIPWPFFLSLWPLLIFFPLLHLVFPCKSGGGEGFDLADRGAGQELWKEQLKLSLKSQKRRLILWQPWIKMLHSSKFGDNSFSKYYSNCWIKTKSKADENHPPKMQWQLLVIVSP